MLTRKTRTKKPKLSVEGETDFTISQALRKEIDALVLEAYREEWEDDGRDDPLEWRLGYDTSDDDGIKVSLETNNEPEFAFLMSELPGCCGVIVFHDLDIKTLIEPTRLRIIAEVAEAFAQFQRKGLIIGTDRISSLGETGKAMIAGGWKKVEVSMVGVRDSFTNHNTSHRLAMWVKVITGRKR
jgi:hypothetical protein